jgi:thiamine-phosphate pyrophosphorylase
VSTVSAAIEGGVSIVQFREKQPTSEEDHMEAGRAVAEVCRSQGVPFLVNDDAQLARRLDADGVHVGHGDTPPETARSLLGPTAIVGVTVYGGAEEENLARDAGADYIAVGPFFPSPTKPTEPVLPFPVLGEVVSRSRLPVFAIGGITADRARELARHRIAGVAVVSAIMDASDPRRAAEEIRRAFEEGVSASSRRAR